MVTKKPKHPKDGKSKNNKYNDKKVSPKKEFTPKQSKLIRLNKEEKIEIIEKVIDLVGNHGKSLKAACDSIPTDCHNFTKWINDYPEYLPKYARAREDLYDHIANEIMTLSDNSPRINPLGCVDAGDVALRRLQVDSRKWFLSKVAPRKYGEKLEITGDKDNPLEINNKMTLDVTRLSSSTLKEIIESRKNDIEQD